MEIEKTKAYRRRQACNLGLMPSRSSRLQLYVDVLKKRHTSTEANLAIKELTFRIDLA